MARTGFAWLTVDIEHTLVGMETATHLFAAIADAVDIPILVYNIPGRSVVEISVETMARLSKIANIIGVKDATNNLARPTRERLACAKDWIPISGEDITALGYMAHGGRGCISVTANVAPRLCADFQQACAAGDLKLARELNDRLYPLHYAMFEDASPGPVKYALSRVHDWIEPGVRLPLVECSDRAKKAVDEALEHAGLI